MKLTKEMILEILENNAGATYYIANLIKNRFQEWERSTSKVLYIMKKLEKEGIVKRLKSSYKTQLSWKLCKDGSKL